MLISLCQNMKIMRASDIGPANEKVTLYQGPIQFSLVYLSHHTLRDRLRNVPPLLLNPSWNIPITCAFVHPCVYENARAHALLSYHCVASVEPPFNSWIHPRKY